MQEMWFPSKEEGGVVGRIAEARAPDVKASDAAGKTIWKMVPVLLSKIPGQHDIASQAVKPHNKAELCARFPGAWERYEAEKNMTAQQPAFPVTLDGTPLDKADFLPREKLAWLVTLGFSTVEQIADMSDATTQNIKGASKWRKQAQEFLKRT